MDPILKNLIRVGTVSSVDAERCTARISFEAQGSVSYEMPIIVRGSLNTKDYWLPEPGEQVLCVSLANGNAQGFVLGAFYSNVDKPPVKDKNKRHIQFSDGTTVEYDTKSKVLNIDAKGVVQIKAAGNVIVTGDVIADGISLKNHTHSGVTSGTSNSGEPVGGA